MVTTAHLYWRCGFLRWDQGLRSLTTDHLDVERGGLILDARWTKNRSEGFQRLPRSLVARLHAYAQSGEPEALYARSYIRRDAKLKAPANPLLYVPSSLSRDFDKDLRAAGIPKRTAAGKVDFHAYRVAYINLVMESATTEKERNSRDTQHRT